VQRASAPGKGFWAIPGGLVELGETVREAAERELLEETGVSVRAREAFFIFDFIDRDAEGKIKYHYIIVDFLADYLGGEPKAADDVSDARWVSPDEAAALNLSPTTRRLLVQMKFIS